MRIGTTHFIFDLIIENQDMEIVDKNKLIFQFLKDKRVLPL